jgi:hypothetical protein
MGNVERARKVLIDYFKSDEFDLPLNPMTPARVSLNELKDYIGNHKDWMLVPNDRIGETLGRAMIEQGHSGEYFEKNGRRYELVCGIGDIDDINDFYIVRANH